MAMAPRPPRWLLFWSVNMLRFLTVCESTHRLDTSFPLGLQVPQEQAAIRPHHLSVNVALSPNARSGKDDRLARNKVKRKLTAATKNPVMCKLKIQLT